MIPSFTSFRVVRSARRGFALNSSLVRPVCCGADVLHVEAEDAGELGEIVDVAAGSDQAEHVAFADRLGLGRVEAVFAGI